MAVGYSSLSDNGKWLVKGNHDYWWTTQRKMEAYFAKMGFDTLHILHNNCCITGRFALCGTRGWLFDDSEPQDAKVMAREVGRLKTSLEAAGDCEKLVFLHYPPVYPGACAEALLAVLRQYGVQRCWYGHLHGKSIRYAVQGVQDGICYKLISADGLHFCPWKIEN